MSEMVERIARAMALADGEDYMESHREWDRRARAALEAMKEPTEAMIGWAVPAAYTLQTEGPERDQARIAAAEKFATPRRQEFIAQWRNAITAALDEV